MLAAEVELPGDIHPGDRLAVPVAGAYQLSVASGYNMVGRPPVVAVHEGACRLLIRRETLDDFRSRDIGREPASCGPSLRPVPTVGRRARSPWRR